MSECGVRDSPSAADQAECPTVGWLNHQLKSGQVRSCLIATGALLNEGCACSHRGSM